MIQRTWSRETIAAGPNAPRRVEAQKLEATMKSAGVPTSYYDGLGLIHGYFGLGEASETAKREAQRARAKFKALLEPAT